jgi:hypothetical protein
MVRKAKKSKSKKIAKRSMKKTKHAPEKKAKAKKPLTSEASPLENIPFMLGYAFYSKPSGR